MNWTIPLPADAAAGQDHFEVHDQLRDAIAELRAAVDALEAQIEAS